MRRAARVDTNHAEIVAALRQVGCNVLSLAAIGAGVPDLLVYAPMRQELMLIEVKDGARRPSERRLTPDQTRFHAEWRGLVVTVESVDDALGAVNL